MRVRVGDGEARRKTGGTGGLGGTRGTLKNILPPSTGIKIKKKIAGILIDVL